MLRCFLFLLLLLPVAAHAQQTNTVPASIKDTVGLKEVVVSTKTAVKISGDTVSYTVDSLSKNPNATTEDVLKKLPGTEITSDGKIMVNGKEVTKIFINGKQYSAEDIRMLTQTMPAQVIDKIQLADWYDEDAQFTGIKKGGSTEKMLNLKIKKDYERGIVGQAIAGAGTKNTYQAGTFTNYMSHDTRITLIAKMNNTGMQDVGITNSGNADNTRASTPNASGITTRRFAEVSFSNDTWKKTKLTGNYTAVFTDNAQQQSSLRNTYLPGDSSLLQKQNRDLNSTAYSHRVSAKSDWAIDSMHSLQTDVNLSYRSNKNKSINNDGTYYNTTDNINFSRASDIATNSEGYGMKLGNTLRKKFRKKRRTATASVIAEYNKDNNTGDNYNLNQYYSPASTNHNDYISNDKRNVLNTSANLGYNEPIGKWHSVSINYTGRYNLSERNWDVATVNNNVLKTDSVQSREFDTHNTENNIRLGYQYDNTKLRGNIEAGATPFSRDVVQRGYFSNTVLSQSNTNYNIGGYLNYIFKPETNISLHYNVSIRQPEITQLQAIPDYRDSFNIALGNPNLLPETSNSVYTAFNSNSKNGKQNIWLNANYNASNNKVVDKTDITASKRVSMPVNANGYYRFSVSGGYYIKWEKWMNSNISASTGYANNIVIANNQLLNLPNTYYSLAAKLVFTFGEWYEGDITYNYSNTNIQSTNNTANVLQKHAVVNTATFTLPYKIRFIYYLNYIHNEGLTAAYNPDFVLVNATVEKSFFKSGSLVVRAQGFDVFNNYPNVQRTFGDNYYEDRSVNRLGRFFMLSLIYKFNYFPYKK